MLTVLSQSTTDRNSHRGYQALKARYPAWEAVLAAPVGEIEAVIRPAGFPGKKRRASR